MKKIQTIVLLISFMMLVVMATGVTIAQDESRPLGWDDYSHSNDTEPVYEVVFPQDAVNTITITMSPEEWQAVQDDLTNLLGEFGASQNRGDRPEGGNFNQQPPTNGAGAPPVGGNGAPQAGGNPNFENDRGVGVTNFSDEDPMWVTVDITFEGQTWTNVGFRFKGNSTLSGAWGSGSLKMGFKLNFDKFEDDFPEIDNQRFYGFDELSFSNNYRDSSYLREKVAADLFRDAGIPSAQTAFYAIYMDYGEGPVYVGLYTGIEEIDDTVIETQFADDDGNLYKPEGTGATFQQGLFDEASFEKKTNEDDADYSDILALFDALHDTNRTADATNWRANLESVLDVDGFIHWLAVNTVIQNWDTYGAMSHNYYLYNDPATGLLTWIPWDNNEALQNGNGGGQGGNNNGIDLTTTSDTWPFISYLIADPVYNEMYAGYVEETINGVFDTTTITATYQRLHDLIAPYVLGDATGTPDMDLVSQATFDNALAELITHANQRATLVEEFLSNQ